MKSLSYVIALLATIIIAFQCRVSRRSTSRYTGTFEGCFQGRSASFAIAESWSNNLNSRCIDYCREHAHPVAVTQGPQCGCCDSMIDLLPRLARPDDGNATGPESRCNLRCPGTPGRGACHEDTCCGGDSAFSVFIVGNIDSVKTILSRAVSALERDNFERLKLWDSEANYNPSKDGYRHYTIKHGFRLYYHDAAALVTDNAYDCWKKCTEQAHCQGATWSDKNHMVRPNRNCYLISDGTMEKPHTGWTSYLKGLEKNWQNADGKRLHKNHYEMYKLEGNPLTCREDCLSDRTCGAATFNFISNWCYLYKYGDYLVDHGQDNWYSWEFETLKELVVQTTATSLNSQGEEAVKKRCEASISGYSCSSSTDIEPTASTTLEVISMERELVHSMGRNLKPLGSYDFEKDNTGSDQPAKVTKEIRITDSDTQSWNTNSGSDISYSVGSKSTAKVGFEAFGVTAETSMEISAQITESGFFSKGYSKTKTSTVQETVRIEYTVPPGHKLLINFFKETYQLEIKWRSKMIARGKVLVNVYGEQKEFYLSEVLSLPERTAFAFGTINLGEREKIISIAKQINREGDIFKHELYSVRPQAAECVRMRLHRTALFSTILAVLCGRMRPQ